MSRAARLFSGPRWACNRDGQPMAVGRRPPGSAPCGTVGMQPRWTTDGRDARASHGHERPPACARAKKLAPVSRELRAKESPTGRLQDYGPPSRGTRRTAPNPAWCRGARKRKRPTGEGWAWNGGGQGRNRTADTGIFSPLLYQLSYLAKELPIKAGNGSLSQAAYASPIFGTRDDVGGGIGEEGGRGAGWIDEGDEVAAHAIADAIDGVYRQACQ